MVATANSDKKKGMTMPIIENTAVIPNVSDDFHLLEIEEVETIEGTKYGEPDVPETRIKMALRVRTPGEPDESFTAWMSPKLGEKATLGGIVRGTRRCTARRRIRHGRVDRTRLPNDGDSQ
jgi:hypothetical protein